LTREKIVAAAAQTFICIVDETKLVDVLGRFPLPVEVIPMAASYVLRTISELGGDPQIRKNFVTDNGNIILDVHGLSIENAAEMEQTLNNVVGAVTNGLFANRPANIMVVGGKSGVQIARA